MPGRSTASISAARRARELVALLRASERLVRRAGPRRAGRPPRSEHLAVLGRNGPADPDDPRLALQGLWGLYVSGGFDDALADDLLSHPGEYVRAWTVRLLGDDGTGLCHAGPLASRSWRPPTRA